MRQRDRKVGSLLLHVSEETQADLNEVVRQLEEGGALWDGGGPPRTLVTRVALYVAAHGVSVPDALRAVARRDRERLAS